MVNIKEYSINKNELFLSELLDQHQKDCTGTEKNKQKEYSFAVFEGENQIGGITGRIHGNTFHISLLAVNDKHRKSGIGKMLVEKLENIANDEKIKHLTVSTQDYQALEFYQKNGFNVFGKLPNAPFDGTTKYYLDKVLR